MFGKSFIFETGNFFELKYQKIKFKGNQKLYLTSICFYET